MKQTAIEWLVEQLNYYGDMTFNKFLTLGEYHIKKQELFEQAKEMEKQQIIDGYDVGLRNGYIDSGKSPEQYYKEIYGI